MAATGQNAPVPADAETGAPEAIDGSGFWEQERDQGCGSGGSQRASGSPRESAAVEWLCGAGWDEGDGGGGRGGRLELLGRSDDGDVTAHGKFDSEATCRRGLVIVGEALADLSCFDADEGVLFGLEVDSFSEDLMGDIALLDLVAAALDGFKDDVAEEVLTALAGSEDGAAADCLKVPAGLLGGEIQRSDWRALAHGR